MTMNGVMSLILCISLTSVAFGADYVKVVEHKPILSEAV